MTHSNWFGADTNFLHHFSKFISNLTFHLEILLSKMDCFIISIRGWRRNSGRFNCTMYYRTQTYSAALSIPQHSGMIDAGSKLVLLNTVNQTKLQVKDVRSSLSVLLFFLLKERIAYYKKMIKKVMFYGWRVWLPSSLGNLQRVFCLQKGAVHVIFNAGMRANSVHFEVKVNIIYNEQGTLYMNNL